MVKFGLKLCGIFPSYPRSLYSGRQTQSSRADPDSTLQSPLHRDGGVPLSIGMPSLSNSSTNIGEIYPSSLSTEWPLSVRKPSRNKTSSIKNDWRRGIESLQMMETNWSLSFCVPYSLPIILIPPPFTFRVIVAEQYKTLKSSHGSMLKKTEWSPRTEATDLWISLVGASKNGENAVDNIW